MQQVTSRALGALAVLLALCACAPTQPAPAAAPPTAASAALGTPAAAATAANTPTAEHIPTPTLRPTRVPSPTPTIRFSRPVPTPEPPSDSTLVLRTADVYLTVGGDTVIDRRGHLL